MAAITGAYAQDDQVINLFRDFEARAVGGTPGTGEEAFPILERLAQGSRQSVVGTLPVILQAATDSHVSVRRVAAFALYEITTRPDGPALLSEETATFAALLIDSDLVVRRVSGLAVGTLRPGSSSPFVPILRAFLARQDAVSTIGAGVATVLMVAAPNDVDSTNTLVKYMRRKDQTSASREDLLNAITHVAKSKNPEIGKEVAAYADDPNEQTSLHAVETLQAMGKRTIQDNQQSLSRIAADTSRALSVRTAAAKALSGVP